jgi:predicted AlkP superfamily pyrophosphatase or phosphodiesterase
MGIGGETGGDIYLDLLPGYDFDARLNSKDLIVRREPYGTHGFNPTRMSMRTIMVLNGPGVAVGRRLTEARTIDFAPTLAKLLGIEAPRDATGGVLIEALSR